jgi:hypothetical protein
MLQKVSKAVMFSVMCVCLVLSLRSVAWADGSLCDSSDCSDNGCIAQGGKCATNADSSCTCNMQ